MSLNSSLRGFAVGLIVASGLLVLTKPAPVLNLEPKNDLVTAEFQYSRFMPLPEVVISGKERDEPIYKKLKRITMDDGEPGVRLVVLFNESKIDPNFI